MGLISFGSARSHIYNHTIINPVNHGIDVRHGSGPNCTVENNTIIGAREGIYLMHSAGHKALNNILNFCDVGITCYGSSNIFCDGNQFLNKTKIGFLLASGYTNIQIGENNDYSGLVFVPMPPTFTYNIVKADNSYVGATNGTFSQIVPVETAITANALTTVAKTNKNLVFTLKDEKDNLLANKNVTVSINGKTSTLTTNANGQATIKTNFAAAGTYYYSICFLGDEGCKASFATVKVTVNKQATKAVFPAKTFKVKATKNLYFTLKDASNKVLAGKKVTFTINKKTYTAKTNSKGVATVKIALTKKGKFLAVAKFAGDSAYKPISKKAYITIK
jgi:parallel beta-helix repeat protein